MKLLLSTLFCLSLLSGYSQTIKDTPLDSTVSTIDTAPDATLFSVEPKVNSVSIYPNPASAYLVLNFENHQEENVSIMIYDLHGRIMHEYSFNATIGSHHKTFPLKGFDKGYYLLQLKGTGYKITKQFLVKG